MRELHSKRYREIDGAMNYYGCEQETKKRGAQSATSLLLVRNKWRIYYLFFLS